MAERPTRLIVLRYSRVLPHPLAACYEWLTDYQDDDPSRTDAVVKRRPVLERHPDRVVLDGTVELLGTRRSGKSEVRLYPPDRYEAHIIEGHGRGTVYRYQLTPVPGGTRLDVAYEMATRRLGTYLKLQLARPLILREIDRMWAGFARSMDADLAPAKPA